MAATSAGVEKLYELLTAKGGLRADDVPKLDLDTYLQAYTGRLRYDRLMCIAQTSTFLCVDALKAAIAEAKKGIDTQRYKSAVELIQMADATAPEATIDTSWVERTDEENAAITTRLETELRSYKNSLIKDSIRLGNEDVGKHFEASGKLADAADLFARMKLDISSHKQAVEVAKHQISIAVQMRQWRKISNTISKTVGFTSGEDHRHQPYIKVLGGIASLGKGDFPEAARMFLVIKSLEDSESYNEYASPNDVAVYGGLVALATMNRTELQKKVLDSSTFRPFLELEPHIRQAITHFVNGRYSACLAMLESRRTDYLLDIFLQSHVQDLLCRVRQKCIVQYIRPFSCVMLDSLSTAFAVSDTNLEEELASMIQSKVLNARIDLINQVVTTVHVNQRARMQAAALAAVSKYERKAVRRARRTAILAAGLEVQGRTTQATTTTSALT